MGTEPDSEEFPPPEFPARPPEVTDRPPEEVDELLHRLSIHLDGSGIPPKVLDRNLLIATWNLRMFGRVTKKWRAGKDDSPKRDLGDIRCVAEIVRRFDVVALQEIRGNLQALRYMLKVLGPEWGLILTDVTKGELGNDERMAFVFDTRRVRPSGLACELVVSIESNTQGVEVKGLDRQFARTPYAVSFISSGRTFILVTLHVIFGESVADRLGELREIATWLSDWAKEVDDFNQNLIALGDFNVDRQGDPAFEAFTSTGLKPPPQLHNLPRTIFSEPGSDKNHFFDQIAWFPDKLSLEFAGEAGHYPFDDVLQGSMTKNELSFKISDHYPLWANFNARNP